MSIQIVDGKVVDEVVIAPRVNIVDGVEVAAEVEGEIVVEDPEAVVLEDAEGLVVEAVGEEIPEVPEVSEELSSDSESVNIPITIVE